MSSNRICFLSILAALAGMPAAAAPLASCGPEKLGTAREIAVDGGEGLALGLQSYPRTLALGDHEVVLTFDDGPGANDAARVERAQGPMRPSHLFHHRQ